LSTLDKPRDAGASVARFLIENSPTNKLVLAKLNLRTKFEACILLFLLKINMVAKFGHSGYQRRLSVSTIL